MTQPDDSRDLPPGQDAVRRLLAEARHDEPVPPAVAARLDAVLERLSAERREVPRTAPVVDLDARRRRRGVGVALMAAAAVVVAGVGIGQVLGGTGSSDMGSSSDGGGIASGEAEDRAEGPEATDGRAPAETQRKENDSALSAGPTFDVSSESLRRDLRIARQHTASSPANSVPEPCAPAESKAVGAGKQVPVTLDGQPALALYRVPEGTRQQVDVFLCGATVPVESVTLRAR